MAKRGSQLKIGMILSYLSIAINIVAGLIYTPWMIGKIGGMGQYGLYTIVTNLLSLFLVDFGLSSATARYVSKYRAERQEEKIAPFLGAVYKLYLLIDAVILAVFVGIFFFLEQIYTGLTPAELSQLRVVYAIAAIFSVFNFPFVTFNGILTSYERFIPLKLADILYRILIVGLTVGALLMGFGLYAVVSVNAIAGVIVILFKYIMIKSTTTAKVSFKKTDKGLYKEIFSFSLWTTIAMLAQRLIFTITPSILGIVSDSAQAGVFGVVITLEQYTYLLTSSAINGMFMPKVAKLYADGQEDKLLPLMNKVGKFQFALNGLIVAGFAVVGKDFLLLWMPEGLTVANCATAYAGVLLVLIPGLFINSLQTAETALTVIKRVDLQAYINLITGVINVALSFVLSYFYGAIGACISICVAYVIRAIILNIVVNKVLKVNIKRFILECYLRMAVPILVAIAFGFGLNYLLPYGGWIWLVIKACGITALYLLIVFSVGITRADRSAFFGFIMRKLGKKKAPAVAEISVQEAEEVQAEEDLEE